MSKRVTRKREVTMLVKKGARAGGAKRTRSRFAALRGTRKTGMTTDEIMNLLRGYEEDARDPGFRVRKK